MPAARFLLPALVAAWLAPAAGAQTAVQPETASASERAALREAVRAPRVLFAVSDSVKGDDGVRRRIDTVVTYDPVAGEYAHELREADGRVLSRAVRATSVAGPTADEARWARAEIAAHPEIARLVAAARGAVVVDGGFPLVREAGHPCGPGGRCATYDVFEVSDGGRRRLRYVVVDLRAGRVLDADADPQGNLAHPDARRQSRLR